MSKRNKLPDSIRDTVKNNIVNADDFNPPALRESLKNISSALEENPGYPLENVTSKDYLDKMIRAASSFSYDVNADPLYKQYRDMYEKESSLAAKNVFGLASALTGGYGNSYALSAVNGVVNDYVDKLSDSAASLREDAYEKHRDKLSDLYNAYKIYSEKEDKEYDRAIKQEEKEYERAEAKEEKEYERALKKEEKESKAKEQAYSLAFKAADAGDYSILQSLGVDISSLIKRDEEERAQLLAKYGDYSGLEKIGVDISELEKEELTEIARLFASYGDYTLLEQLGADMEGARTEDYYNRLLLKAKYRNMLW